MLALLIASGAVFAISYAPSEVKHSEPMKMQEMEADPMEQFQIWYAEAKKEIGELNASAFVLGTVSEACEPSTRGMIAKEVDETGFTFYGDKDSKKFQDLSQNPAASATFMWLDQQRQVNFRGKAVPVSQKEMQDAFDKRAKGSQITSHLSDQGEKLSSHEQMSQKHQMMSRQYRNKKVPMADSWMGYRFEPEIIYFWQAGEYNMHSRVMYVKDSKGKWTKTMLQP